MQYPSDNLPVQKPKLLDQVREKIRFKHYSIRTEQAYTDWIRRLCILASGICVKWGRLRSVNF
ncbi:phage integrase N-terminal SAM-like domain-containing protein [Methylovulum psychrotolerans]|uniref:phage integrase N-terminal SAM-like domain-containing protein n=1 Tax=Methylovulum psychrotolerans TaxID=1704499 RepID=UPI001E469AF1|nr:phage integrase N-terminal SAM-like domain-containing protein [Methylovulum psychrotolerans]